MKVHEVRALLKGGTHAEIMADLLGFTRRTLSTKVREGEIQQIARGKYDAFAVLAGQREREKASRETSQLGAASLDLKREQARKQKLKNDSASRLYTSYTS